MKARTRNEKRVEQLRHSLYDRKGDLDWMQSKHTKGKNEYFVIFEKKEEWQVIRYYMFRSYSKKNEVLHEPLRFWFNGKGESVIEHKNRVGLGNYLIDAWSINSEMELRKHQGRDVGRLCYDFARVRSLIPELKRAGFTIPKMGYLFPFYFIKSLLSNSRIETLFKLRQKMLVWKFYYHDELTDSIWQSIRIALRNGYHWDSKEEINDWCDMLNDLEYLGKDTRNAYYICPANLVEAHNHWSDKSVEKRNRERLADELEKVMKYEPTFHANRLPFLDMILTSKNVVITVIPTAMGIKEEGVAMHHCVGGYYNKKDSLILSARVDGRRMETIEVSLKSYQLIQSRGLQNSPSAYHDEIVKLITDNLPEIMKRDLKRKTA